MVVLSAAESPDSEDNDLQPGEPSRDRAPQDRLVAYGRIVAEGVQSPASLRSALSDLMRKGLGECLCRSGAFIRN